MQMSSCRRVASTVFFLCALLFHFFGCFSIFIIIIIFIWSIDPLPASRRSSIKQKPFYWISLNFFFTFFLLPPRAQSAKSTWGPTALKIVFPFFLMHENTGSGLRCHKKNSDQRNQLENQRDNEDKFYFFFSFFVSSAWEKNTRRGISIMTIIIKKKRNSDNNCEGGGRKKKKKKENKTKKKVSLVDPDFPIRFVCVCVCAPRTEIEKKKGDLARDCPSLR